MCSSDLFPSHDKGALAPTGNAARAYIYMLGGVLGFAGTVATSRVQQVIRRIIRLLAEFSVVRWLSGSAGNRYDLDGEMDNQQDLDGEV